MGYSIHPIQVPDMEALKNIFDALDDAGLKPELDEDLGTASFSLNDVDVVEFQLHMGTVLEDEFWAEDAKNVADYYWRQ